MTARMPEAAETAARPRTSAPDASELSALSGWLRSRLRSVLQTLRSLHGGPRTELEALLEAPTPLPLFDAPPLPEALRALAVRLSLRDEERTLLALLLATALEPALGRALGLLCDPLGRGAVTWASLLRLLALPSTHRLTPEDGLVRWGLVVFGPEDSLALSPFVEARLLGRHARDAELVAHVSVIPAHAPLPGWDLEAALLQIKRALSGSARGARICLRGADGSGRRTLFAGLARALGLTAVGVHSDACAPGPARAVLRLAALDDLAPVWLERVRLPQDLPPPLLQGWLCAEPPEAPIRGVLDLTLSVPAPDHSARRAAWCRLVPAFEGWPAPEQTALVERWSARPGQLVKLGVASVPSPEHASTLLRSDAAERLEGHCEILATPFSWDDLVLPPALLHSLHELAFEARALPALLDDASFSRLFPQGRSVAALFCGPPGTGKTMAAQVIARALGLPLFRVDLSRMISKYIGETSQNLARLLGAARDADAVIFFDEADALFGRRTEIQDAHDRYANTDTDFLLQALDAFPGVALLASNQRGAIDPAFMRRMRTILEFPRPDAVERGRLWSHLLGSLVPDCDATLTHSLQSIVDGIEFTGAQIKGALLSARLAAARSDDRVRIAHVVRGIERELEKEGRGFSQRERKRLLEPGRDGGG